MSHQRKYLKYKQKNLILEKIQHGGANSDIFSLGFELQSSDFYTVIVNYDKNSDIFIIEFATVSDIPENTPVDLFTVEKDKTKYQIQLDAVDMEIIEDKREKYIKTIEEFVVPGTNVVLLHSEHPQDSEFVVINLDHDSVLHFEPDKNNINYTELIKTNFEYIKTVLFYFNLRDNYTKIEYLVHDSSVSQKVNILYLPKNLKKDGSKHIGFYHSGFVNPSDPTNINQISYVPQVTFQCTLQYAYFILKDLFKNTPINEHSEAIGAIDLKIKNLFGDNYNSNVKSEILSIMFLMLYYHNIMKTHGSKQKLAFAVRHNFKDIFESLDIEIQKTIAKIENFVIFANEISEYEKIDGVHRYTYSKEDKKILIEYRLFGYMVSGKSDDNSEVITLK